MSACNKHDDEHSRPYGHDCFECAVDDEMRGPALSFVAAFDSNGEDENAAKQTVVDSIYQNAGEVILIYPNDDGSSSVLMARSAPKTANHLCELDEILSTARREAAREIVNERRKQWT